jgi:hypothetical protein
MDRSSSLGSANLKSAEGRVSKVDSDGKTIVINSRQDGRITLKVDDNTQIVDSSGGSSSSDLSSIREGSQVRASFDPSSNRAQRIEVMGKSGKRGMHKKSGSTSDTTGGSADRSEGSLKTKAPNPNTSSNPAQDTTGRPSSQSDQKQ